MIHYSRFQFLDLNNIYDIISNKSFDHFAETDKTTITVYQLLQQNYHHFFLFNKLGLPAWFAIETEVIKIQTRIFFPAVDFWNYQIIEVHLMRESWIWRSFPTFIIVNLHHCLTSSLCNFIWDSLEKRGKKIMDFSIKRLDSPPPLMEKQKKIWDVQKKHENTIFTNH